MSMILHEEYACTQEKRVPSYGRRNAPPYGRSNNSTGTQYKLTEGCAQRLQREWKLRSKRKKRTLERAEAVELKKGKRKDSCL